MFDCQQVRAAHPGFLHGRGGAGTTGETGIQTYAENIWIGRSSWRTGAVFIPNSPAVGQEAAADVSGAVAAWRRTRHPVRLPGLPDELRAVHVAVFLPLGRQGAA